MANSIFYNRNIVINCQNRLCYRNLPATVREGVIVIILELAGPLDGDFGLAPLKTRPRRRAATVL